MNTPPTTPDATIGCAAALARALLADGWSYAHDIGTDPAWGTEIHQLHSPDGCLNLHANDVCTQCCLVMLTGSSVRASGKRRRSWSAQLTVPLPVALAVIAAARQPAATRTPDSVGALLSAAGWHERDDDLDEDDDVEEDDDEFDDEDGPLIRTWAAPDGARSVTWFGPDDDPAFWSVERPHPQDGTTRAHFQFSQHTPAPVIAAAALTD